MQDSFIDIIYSSNASSFRKLYCIHLKNKPRRKGIPFERRLGKGVARSVAQTETDRVELVVPNPHENRKKPAAGSSRGLKSITSRAFGSATAKYTLFWNSRFFTK